MIRIKKTIFLLSFFLLVVVALPLVNAGDNITIDNPTPINNNISNEIVIAEESGHLNTSFNNGYKGYCIEYGEHEANKGDKFYQVNTDYYNNTKYLKTFFVYYYDIAMKDPITTQHIIWYFTDNFNSRLINQSLINDIKNTANNVNINDDGYLKINNNTLMKYSFRILLSSWEHHQDYFIYKIIFENITYENNTIIENNYTNNNISNLTINNNNNTLLEIKEIKKNDVKQIKKNKKYNNYKHITGNKIWIIFCCIIMISVIIIFKRK